MSKKRIYLIIGIALLAIILFILLLNKNVNNKSSEKDNTISNDISNTIIEDKTEFKIINKSIGAKKCSDVSDEYIEELINKYNESTYFVKNEWFPTEKYFVFDFNDDNQMECLLIYENTLYLYQLVDGKVEIVYSKEADNGIYDIFELINNENNQKELLIMDSYADGLCYENCITGLLRIDDNSMIVYEKLANYACDLVQEEKLRNAISERTDLSEIEKEEAFSDAHTLEFRVAGEKVSKEDYHKFEKDLESKYTLLNKTNENYDLFD